MGFIEIAVGLGLGLGPTVGSFVFNFLRYEKTLYFFSLCSFLALLTNSVLIPKSVDKVLDENLTESKLTLKPATWTTVLSNRHAVFGLLMLMMGAFNITYWISYIELRLQTLGLEEIKVGFVLGSASAVYVVNCLLYPYFLEHLPRKLQF